MSGVHNWLLTGSLVLFDPQDQHKVGKTLCNAGNAKQPAGDRRSITTSVEWPAKCLAYVVNPQWFRSPMELLCCCFFLCSFDTRSFEVSIHQPDWFRWITVPSGNLKSLLNIHTFPCLFYHLCILQSCFSFNCQRFSRPLGFFGAWFLSVCAAWHTVEEIVQVRVQPEI